MLLHEYKKELIFLDFKLQEFIKKKKKTKLSLFSLEKHFKK